MDQLGFTFYPRDWWTSKTFIMLTPAERYIYLEALFYMYLNPGGLEDDREFFAKFLRTEIDPRVWENATKSFTREGNLFLSETVLKRRRLAQVSRENGGKGGRPKGEKITQKTQKNNPEKPSKTQPYKEKEKRKETKQTLEKGFVSSDNGETSNPVASTPGGVGDLNGPGPKKKKRPATPAGVTLKSFVLADQKPRPLCEIITTDPWQRRAEEAVRDYGKILEAYLEDGISRDKMLGAFAFFWPLKISPENLGEIAETFKTREDCDIEIALGELAENLKANKRQKLIDPLDFITGADD